MGNNNKKRFFKFTFAVTATTVLEKVIFFSLTVIIAQYLSVNDYGIYTTALGYATFFLAFSDIGLNVTLIRAINLDQDNENENVSTVVFVKTILLLFVFSIMVLSLYFTSHTSEVVYLILLFGLVRVGSEYQNTFYSMFEAKEKFLILSFFKSGFAVTLLGGTFLVIVYKGGYFELAYIRIAIIVGYLLWMSVSILKRFKFKFAFNLSIIKSFLANTVPFAVSTIFAIVIFQLGIVILPLMHDSSLVGIYSNGQLFLLTLY
ncbi:MAG: oligosaccharide flippase family protein, partial [bacterium]|nr:oligosaccharide flippase family protein [bacterium]